MVDKVKPLITERNGTNLEFENEIVKNTDFVEAAGLSFWGSDNHLIERVAGVLKFKVPDFSVKPSYDSNEELEFVEIYNGNIQTNPNRIMKGGFIYTGDNLTLETWVIYDTADGVTILKTLTYNHYYDANDNYIRTEASEV